MPSIFREKLERKLNAATLGIGSFVLFQVVTGYMDRRATRIMEREDSRHLAEMALEKEASVDLPPNEPDELDSEWEQLDAQQHEDSRHDR